MFEKYDFMGKLDKYRDYAPLVLRLVAGVIYAAHGWSKLMNPAGTAGFFGGIGIPMPMFFAWVVIFAEFAGGIGLILGLFTRYFAKLQVITMIVAIWLVHFKNGLTGQGGYEFALSLLAISLSLELTGSGKWSLDNLICGKKGKKK